MNKQKIAVALEYGSQKAPVVVATGVGELAQKIIDIAIESDIPIQKEEDLVELLATLSLEEEIPEVLYRAVSEVLAFSYWIRGMKPGDKQARR